MPIQRPENTVPAAPAEPDPAAVGFILHLGRALHSYGESSHRLEDIIKTMADRLGLGGAQFFSQPTSIMASFGPLERQRTHMLRIEPGEVDLGRLAAIERLSLEVADGDVTPSEGTERIVHIGEAPPPYGATLTTLAYAALSGATCQLLGGGWREIIAASLLGFGLRLFAILAGGRPRLTRVFEPLSAFLVSFSVVAIAHLVAPLSVLIATLGGLIVLLPGLTLTTALSELSNRHLASGTARLSGALITFLGLAFGVAFGTRVGVAALGDPPNFVVLPLPLWLGLGALLVSSVAAAVIFRAPPRDIPWIVAASILGVEGGRLGAVGLGAELGAFVGAFAIGLVSNVYARWRRRAPMVVLVPSILLLVPGSVGFRSLAWLMERQALAGIETAFSMMLTAVALVAGLLIAGVVAPEPRLQAERGA